MLSCNVAVCPPAADCVSGATANEACESGVGLAARRGGGEGEPCAKEATRERRRKFPRYAGRSWCIVSEEAHIGVRLPCNVIVRRYDDGEV